MAFDDNNSLGNSAPTPTPVASITQPANGDAQVTAPQNQTQSTPQAPQPTQPSSPQIVSNPAQPTQDPNQDHPSVQRAGLLHSIAETLAGGPRYTQKIDENGNRVV